MAGETMTVGILKMPGLLALDQVSYAQKCDQPFNTIIPIDETTCTEGAIRLVGGADAYEGRIEICHNGVWGTICDDFWSANDGVVACRQLGLDYVATTTRAYYGEGTGEIWLDNVMCTGSETELADCTHNGFGMHNCIHREDAGLLCGCELRTQNR